MAKSDDKTHQTNVIFLTIYLSTMKFNGNLSKCTTIL